MKKQKHPVQRVREAMGEAAGKKMSRKGFCEFLGRICSESKIEKIETRVDGQRGKVPPDLAEKVFHRCSAIIHPFVAFKGTSCEMHPECEDALNLKGDEYTAADYATVLGAAEPMIVPEEDREELEVNLTFWLNVLMKAAGDEGRTHAVVRDLWETMDRARTQYGLGATIERVLKEHCHYAITNPGDIPDVIRAACDKADQVSESNPLKVRKALKWPTQIGSGSIVDKIRPTQFAAESDVPLVKVRETDLMGIESTKIVGVKRKEADGSDPEPNPKLI